MAKQQIVSISGDGGTSEDTIAIPFDGEKLEQLFSMITRGLVWYHWRVYLESGYEVQTQTVTAYGLQVYEDKLLRKNARNRVCEDLGNGTFAYEGAQAVDDPAVTVWKFRIYGGLASYEDDISPSTLGSHLVSMTGPSAAFTRAQT